MKQAAVIFALTFSTAAADVVVLADGDRITGTVQKIEKGKLFIKSKHSETPLQIDWTVVSRLTTDLEMKISLQDGREEMATLIDSASGLTMLVAGNATNLAPSAVLALAPKPVRAAEDTGGRLRRAWDNSSLSLDFGQSYSGIAGYHQLSSNTEAEYNGDRWDGSLMTHFDYYGATDSSSSTYQTYGRLVVQRYLRGDHFFLFPYAFLGRQTTPDGGSGQIRQFGGGAGWTFRRQKSDQVSLYSGLVRSIGSGFAMANSEIRADARIIDTLAVIGATWERTLARNIETSVRLFYFKPVTKSGQHAVATDASAKVPLFGPAYFTVRAYDTPELAQRHLFSVKNLQLSSGFGVEF